MGPSEDQELVQITGSRLIYKQRNQMMKSGAKSNSTLFSALLVDYNNLLCSDTLFVETGQG